MALNGASLLYDTYEFHSECQLEALSYSRGEYLQLKSCRMCQKSLSAASSPTCETLKRHVRTAIYHYERPGTPPPPSHTKHSMAILSHLKPSEAIFKGVPCTHECSQWTPARRLYQHSTMLRRTPAASTMTFSFQYLCKEAVRQDSARDAR